MVTDKVRQFLCGLHGHDALLHFERGRISLQCASCGYETPGWVVRSANELTTKAESTQAAQLPLVDHRRAA